MVSKKTKIIVTLGPATFSSEIILRLVREGANVFRLNFSHGDHEEKKFFIKSIGWLKRKLKNTYL